MQRALLFALAAGAALMASLPAHAATDLRKGFVASCESQMLMSKPQCECMADRAETDLDERGMLYLSLAATDVKTTAATAKAMTGAELAAVDKFMKTAPKSCMAAH
jgi:hypothetical protein